MTQRERILTVYRGGTPDVVPFMLDLSHWFYAERRLPWDLSAAYEKPEFDLIDYHRREGVGFYIPNLASLFSVSYAPGVRASVEKHPAASGEPEIAWRFETPSGAIERRRVWEPATYAWGVSQWGIRTKDDLRVLAEALSGRTFAPRFDRYREWEEAVGADGVTYFSVGYSAIGQLLNYWMGVEATIFATVDWPDEMRAAVDAINANTLELVELAGRSPADVVIMGDNFSSDVQSPPFFDAWSRPFYAEAIRRLHAAGKHVAVHIDGRLRGAIRMLRDAGADCGDAITPKPMGDLTPAECRAEAGPDFILSGGISPELWLPSASEASFERAVLEWLELRHASPRLIAAAGDQVPPGAVEGRIRRMRDLVETHGRFG